MTALFQHKREPVRKHEEDKLLTVVWKRIHGTRCLYELVAWTVLCGNSKKCLHGKGYERKVNRNDTYYHSNEWQQGPWHPANNFKMFPTVIIVTDTRYNIESPYVMFIQVQNTEQIVNVTDPQKPPSKFS